MKDIKAGIIEGFYGIPYSQEERLDLIDFLSKLEMSEYIYAPKDDPYHNFKWREKYPKEELDKLKKLNDFSGEKNINFIWAIHPGQNPFDFDNYDEEFKLLMEKYKSLKDINIGSFALCMDDIDRNIAYDQRHMHERLISDIIEHLDDELLFVSPWYNSSWIDKKAKDYYKLISSIDRLNIMWTGYDVVVPLRHDSNEYFKKLTGKEADIWFNWPVNDYKRGEIFLEKFEFYDSFDLNFNKLYSNPMNQAETSKISLYQINEFIKKREAYDPDQAFEDAFAFVEKDSYKDLLVLADSFFSSGVYEREEEKSPAEKDIREAFKNKDYDSMKLAIEKKLKAIDSYERNHFNKNLYSELEPFIKALNYQLLALKSVLNKDKDEAKAYMDKKDKITIKIYKEHTKDEIIDRKVRVSENLVEIIDKLGANL